MSLIRARQRAITGIFPHNANRRFLIPNRPSVPVQPDPPVWDAIPGQSDVEQIAITPLDLSTFILSGALPIVYEDIGAQLPTGLSLDVNSGIVTGTPTVVAPPALVSIRATNDDGTDVGSFTWEVTI